MKESTGLSEMVERTKGDGGCAPRAVPYGTHQWLRFCSNDRLYNLDIIVRIVKSKEAERVQCGIPTTWLKPSDPNRFPSIYVK